MFIFQFYFRRFFFFIHSSNFYNNSNAKIVWFRQFSQLPFNVYGGRNCVYMCDCDSNVTYFSWNFALLPNYDWWCDSWFIDCQQWQICWFVTSFSIWRQSNCLPNSESGISKVHARAWQNGNIRAHTHTRHTQILYSLVQHILNMPRWHLTKKKKIKNIIWLPNTKQKCHLTLSSSHSLYLTAISSAPQHAKDNLYHKNSCRIFRFIVFHMCMRRLTQTNCVIMQMAAIVVFIFYVEKKKQPNKLVGQKCQRQKSIIIFWPLCPVWILNHTMTV